MIEKFSEMINEKANSGKKLILTEKDVKELAIIIKNAMKASTSGMPDFLIKTVISNYAKLIDNGFNDENKKDFKLIFSQAFNS